MSWTVYKFGGASVKDAKAVKNLANIVFQTKANPLLIVVSAMGKTTNALEQVWQYWINKKPKEAVAKLNEIKELHQNIASELFPKASFYSNWQQVEIYFLELQQTVSKKAPIDTDKAYDMVVPYGELWSTIIIHTYLLTTNVNSCWKDARKLIITDDTHREAKVNWLETERNIKEQINQTDGIFITQGFIGSGNNQTTLGREGSDYSAAIFAFCLNAKNMTIWKDVPGVLNADPKYFDQTELLANISFKEAIELSYYGATIIHPKTIKPLQNKRIPLFVKSFINPLEKGTEINIATDNDSKLPSFIFKTNQRLISIQPRDFSFIVEENLVSIFDLFASNRVKINVMENSALSFSVCVDENPRILGLIDALKQNFLVRYNENLKLITIRHYNQGVIDKLLHNKQVLLEQKSRETARFVVQ